MSTRIYGASDDLIEFDGDVHGEVYHYSTQEEPGALIICSDGTLLEFRYGKGGAGIWAITIIAQGTLFRHMDECRDENAKCHSDVAHFADGLKFAYVASEWEKVK